MKELLTLISMGHFPVEQSQSNKVVGERKTFAFPLKKGNGNENLSSPYLESVLWKVAHWRRF